MFSIPGYHINSVLYDSRISLICRGYRESDGLAVVLKVMKQEYPALHELNAFQQEFDNCRRIQSPNVINPIALEKCQSRLVIVMEDDQAQALAHCLEQGASQQSTASAAKIPLEVAEFIPLALQMLQGLADIHAAHIIHKDINPSNMIWSQSRNRIKIIDFGISSQHSSQSTILINPHQLEGTLAYMSPEQTGRMNDSLDYRTDIYSMGVSFYELLTAQLPFEANSAMQMVHAHIAKNATPITEINSQVPEILVRIIAKMMAKNVDQRYQSALGVKADIERVQNQESDFIIAENDYSGQFVVPRKLYGRKQEIDTLLQAFERVDDGAAELMLIAGYSGVGKTALVREVLKPMSRNHGNFASGKFDQFQTNIPYLALRQAFAELCHYFLTEEASRLQYWREQILSAVQENGQVLIDVIPQLELIIGPQPAVIELAAQESQNRFNLIFQQFFKALCGKEQPLVLFIDDLQWADTASLDLLKLIMHQSQSQYFLILGAYRDNEVDATHPVTLMKEDLLQAQVTIHQINLHNLNRTDVAQLINDTIKPSTEHSNEDVADINALMALVYEKTHGNAFFTHSFIQSLYEKNLITFAHNAAHKTPTWHWDIDAIRALEMTDNVVKLLADKIEQFSQPSQMLLKLAACIGNQFDLKTLVMISKQKPNWVLENLAPVIEAGLLISLENIRPTHDANNAQNAFKFQHDRIQQAAYWLIDENDKTHLHLQIGRLMLSDQQIMESRLFEVVDHLNIGFLLVQDVDERKQLAELNLNAAIQAKKAAAYHAAIKYLSQAKKCLGIDCWQNHYHLSLEIMVVKAEAEYLSTQYKAAQFSVENILDNAESLLEKVKALDIQIQMNIAQNQMNEAIENGLKVLELLQVELRQTAPDSLEMQEFYDLPVMDDPHKQAAMSILMTLFAPSVIANPALLAPIAYTMIDLCIRYGNSRAAAFAYGFYGTLLCGVLHDIENGYRFGQLSLRVLEKFQAKETQSRVDNLYYAFIVHWKEHPRVAIEPLRDAVHCGLQNGDTEFACYNAVNYIFTLFLSGENLAAINEKHSPYINLIQSQRQEFQLYYAKIWAQLIQNLHGLNSEPLRLKGECFDEDITLPRLQKSKNYTSLFCFYLAKCILHYIFHDNKKAILFAEQAEQNESAMVGLLPVGQRPFYHSLALLGDFSQVELEQQSEYLHKVEQNQQKLSVWAEHAPTNYQHKYDLIEALKAWKTGQNFVAMQIFELAIKGAEEHGFIHESAMIYEIAAYFYQQQQREKFAQLYLREAYYRYKNWGADAKLNQLEQQYPELFSSSQQFLPASADFPLPTFDSSSPTLIQSGKILDLESIMKATENILGEVVLSRLLEKMMSLVIENAGAQIGSLILPDGEEWLIQAQGSMEQGEVIVLQSLALHNRVPQSIISYVLRTHKKVMLNLATESQIYAQDAYIQKHRTQSVLCFPILYQKQLRGLVYLENNLTSGSFNEEHLTILQLLSTQMAIALENAFLYQTLEKKVAQRTEALSRSMQELKETQKQLVESEKMASLGSLVAGLAHEINTPLGICFTAGTLQRDQIHEFQNRYENDQLSRGSFERLLTSMGDSNRLMMNNIERSVSLINSFKQLSVESSQEKKNQFLLKTHLQNILSNFCPLLEKSNFAIEIQGDEQLSIYSYAGTFIEIISNLVSNSILHGYPNEENGLILIRFRTEKHNLILEFGDQGCGMSPEEQGKIFEPFYTTNRAVGSVGLGLHIVYNLVTQKLNGKISVHSSPGEGTEFQLLLPLLEKE